MVGEAVMAEAGTAVRVAVGVVLEVVVAEAEVAGEVQVMEVGSLVACVVMAMEV